MNSTYTDKEKCLENIRVYLGIGEYYQHPSHLSGMFLDHQKYKYGKELVEECIKELTRNE